MFSSPPPLKVWIKLSEPPLWLPRVYNSGLEIWTKIVSTKMPSADHERTFCQITPLSKSIEHAKMSIALHTAVWVVHVSECVYTVCKHMYSERKKGGRGANIWRAQAQLASMLTYMLPIVLWKILCKMHLLGKLNQNGMVMFMHVRFKC